MTCVMNSDAELRPGEFTVYDRTPMEECGSSSSDAGMARAPRRRGRRPDNWDADIHALGQQLSASIAMTLGRYGGSLSTYSHSAPQSQRGQSRQQHRDYPSPDGHRSLPIPGGVNYLGGVNRPLPGNGAYQCGPDPPPYEYLPDSHPESRPAHLTGASLPGGDAYVTRRRVMTSVRYSSQDARHQSSSGGEGSRAQMHSPGARRFATDESNMATRPRITPLARGNATPSSNTRTSDRLGGYPTVGEVVNADRGMRPRANQNPNGPTESTPALGQFIGIPGGLGQPLPGLSSIRAPTPTAPYDSMGLYGPPLRVAPPNTCGTPWFPPSVPPVSGISQSGVNPPPPLAVLNPYVGPESVRQQPGRTSVSIIDTGVHPGLQSNAVVRDEGGLRRWPSPLTGLHVSSYVPGSFLPVPSDSDEQNPIRTEQSATITPQFGPSQSIALATQRGTTQSATLATPYGAPIRSTDGNDVTHNQDRNRTGPVNHRGTGTQTTPRHPDPVIQSNRQSADNRATRSSQTPRQAMFQPTATGNNPPSPPGSPPSSGGDDTPPPQRGRGRDNGPPPPRGRGGRDNYPQGRGRGRP